MLINPHYLISCIKTYSSDLFNFTNVPVPNYTYVPTYLYPTIDFLLNCVLCSNLVSLLIGSSAHISYTLPVPYRMWDWGRKLACIKQGESQSGWQLGIKKKQQRTFSMKKIYMGVMGCQMPALRPGGIFKQIPESWYLLQHTHPF